MELLKKALMPIARRFVAGGSKRDAIERVQQLNEHGISGMINLLGEHLDDKSEVESTVNEYDDILTELSTKELDGCISVKPTQLGLEIDQDYCLDNLKFLAKRARHLDRFMWIDMESSKHTKETLDLYQELLEDYDNVGICIQGYLRRSDEDIERMTREDGIVRLVKGAYKEPKSIAFTSKDEVNAHYRKLLKKLFEDAEYFAVATHNKKLVNFARQLQEQHDRDRDSFEFQFLKGVQNDLKSELVDEGFTVSEYIPYGEEWLSYYWRRVIERKANLLFALKAILWPR